MDILKKNGWRLARIRGSHHIFVKDGHGTVPVPVHGNKDLGNFAKRLLAQAGIPQARPAGGSGSDKEQ
jgi:predicted RNA binding protein YcfA (HicA-like mRNA interferase family)